MFWRSRGDEIWFEESWIIIIGSLIHGYYNSEVQRTEENYSC